MAFFLKNFMILRVALFIVLILAVAVLKSGNASTQEEPWEKIAPIGDTFTISMPTQAAECTRLIPWSNKDTIHVNLYESVKADKRYLAAEFFKTSPDRTTVLSNFDNFVQGVEYSFTTRGAEVGEALRFDHDIPFVGGVGKQYEISRSGYRGVLRLLGKDDAFYALMVIGADQNAAETERFFSSLVIGEVNTSAQLSGVLMDIPKNAAQIETARTSLPPGPWTRPGRPIMGGILNGKAVSLPVPEYPQAAHLAGDAGEVAVQIIIDELGNVAWAEASESPATLRQAAESSAWKARFTPTKLMGQPIKVSGRVIYNFVRSPQ